MIKATVNDAFSISAAIINDDNSMATGQTVNYDVRNAADDSALNPAINGTLTESAVKPGTYYKNITIPTEGDYRVYISCPTFPSMTEDIIVTSEETDIDAIKTETLTHPTLAEIEASAILAKEATLLSNITTGTLQAKITSTGDIMKIKRGDVKTLTLTLSTDWDLTGKKVYFCVKTDKAANNATAIVNRLATILTVTTAKIILTASETGTVGQYYAEWEVRDNDDTNPESPHEFTLIIYQDVRQ